MLRQFYFFASDFLGFKSFVTNPILGRHFRDFYLFVALKAIKPYKAFAKATSSAELYLDFSKLSFRYWCIQLFSFCFVLPGFRPKLCSTRIFVKKYLDMCKQVTCLHLWYLCLRFFPIHEDSCLVYWTASCLRAIFFTLHYEGHVLQRPFNPRFQRGPVSATWQP